MHIPDGFFNAGTSAVGGVAAVSSVAVALRQARDVLADRAIALAGLVSAYVFAVQMLNFPVAAGTSGHLLGGVLAAVLVGPWVGAVCVTVVLVVQALVFADGGLSALGLNVLNMAVLGSFGGYYVFRGIRALAGKNRRGVLIATAIAAWCSPVLAAGAFAIEYAVGGNDAVSPTAVAWAMLGVHALIGIGEAVITTATIGAVLSSRPDLVFGARGIDGASSVGAAGRRKRGLVAGVIAAVAVVVAVGISPFASSNPDGLEKVAADKGIDSNVVDPALQGPLSDYAVEGVNDGRLSTVLAGIIGVILTAAVVLGIALLMRRRRVSVPG